MRTALILGGGGPIGIAWEAGLLLGLQQSGVDLSRVDLIVGTSAGSIVGTHLAVLGSVEQLYAAQSTPLDVRIKPPNMVPLMAAMTRAKLFHRTVEGERKSLARSARRAKIPGEQEWLKAIASFLPESASVPGLLNADDPVRAGSISEISACDTWPRGDLLVTAVETDTGNLVTWTRNSGVPLSTAVASSCAVPCVYPLVQIGGQTYMDGGMGSPTNAILGSGYQRVIIADPLARLMGKRSPMLVEKASLEKDGSQVDCFAFSEAIVDLIGINLMDTAQRGRVAEMGLVQGRSWRGASVGTPLTV